MTEEKERKKVFKLFILFKIKKKQLFIQLLKYSLNYIFKSSVIKWRVKFNSGIRS